MALGDSPEQRESGGHLVFQDKVYGEILINDPLAIKVIQTQAFQRLKGVNQFGGVNFVYPGLFQATRFEHSLGVYHVLHSLQTDRKVQIGGLLHDIGHTALSHMVDMAKASLTEDFHEYEQHGVAEMGQVLDILKPHGISLTDFRDYKEIHQPQPNITADSLDNGIRNYEEARGRSTGIGRRVLKNITLVDHSITFTDAVVAREFAEIGNEGLWDVIYDPKVAVVYQALVEMLRIGMSEGWITNRDLFQDDAHVLRVMRENRASVDRRSDVLLRIFSDKFEVVETNRDDAYDFRHIKKKVRYYDPRVLSDGQSVRLSTIDGGFRATLADKLTEFKKRREGAYYKVHFEK